MTMTTLITLIHVAQLRMLAHEKTIPEAAWALFINMDFM